MASSMNELVKLQERLTRANKITTKDLDTMKKFLLKIFELRNNFNFPQVFQLLIKYILFLINFYHRAEFQQANEIKEYISIVKIIAQHPQINTDAISLLGEQIFGIVLQPDVHFYADYFLVKILTKMASKRIDTPLLMRPHYVLNLMYHLCTSGDFGYQRQAMKLIMRLQPDYNNPEVVRTCFPRSANLQELLMNITDDNFDAKSRDLFNAINGTYETVFTFRAKHLLLENSKVVLPKDNESKQNILWVDFNTRPRTITFSCSIRTFSSKTKDIWIMITIPKSIISSLEIVGQTDDVVEVELTLNGPITVNRKLSHKIIDECRRVRIFVCSKDKSRKSIEEILQYYIGDSKAQSARSISTTSSGRFFHSLQESTDKVELLKPFAEGLRDSLKEVYDTAKGTKTSGEKSTTQYYTASSKNENKHENTPQDSLTNLERCADEALHTGISISQRIQRSEVSNESKSIGRNYKDDNNNTTKSRQFTVNSEPIKRTSNKQVVDLQTKICSRRIGSDDLFQSSAIKHKKDLKTSINKSVNSEKQSSDVHDFVQRNAKSTGKEIKHKNISSTNMKKTNIESSESNASKTVTKKVSNSEDEQFTEGNGKIAFATTNKDNKNSKLIPKSDRGNKTLIEQSKLKHINTTTNVSEVRNKTVSTRLEEGVISTKQDQNQLITVDNRDPRIRRKITPPRRYREDQDDVNTSQDSHKAMVQEVRLKYKTKSPKRDKDQYRSKYFRTKETNEKVNRSSEENKEVHISNRQMKVKHNDNKVNEKNATRIDSVAEDEIERSMTKRSSQGGKKVSNQKSKVVEKNIKPNCFVVEDKVDDSVTEESSQEVKDVYISHRSMRIKSRDFVVENKIDESVSEESSQKVKDVYISRRSMRIKSRDSKIVEENITSDSSVETPSRKNIVKKNSTSSLKLENVTDEGKNIGSLVSQIHENESSKHSKLEKVKRDKRVLVVEVENTTTNHETKRSINICQSDPNTEKSQKSPVETSVSSTKSIREEVIPTKTYSSGKISRDVANNVVADDQSTSSKPENESSVYSAKETSMESCNIEKEKVYDMNSSKTKKVHIQQNIILPKRAVKSQPTIQIAEKLIVKEHSVRKEEPPAKVTPTAPKVSDAEDIRINGKQESFLANDPSMSLNPENETYPDDENEPLLERLNRWKRKSYVKTMKSNQAKKSDKSKQTKRRSRVLKSKKSTNSRLQTSKRQNRPLSPKLELRTSNWSPNTRPLGVEIHGVTRTTNSFEKNVTDDEFDKLFNKIQPLKFNLKRPRSAPIGSQQKKLYRSDDSYSGDYQAKSLAELEESTTAAKAKKRRYDPSSFTGTNSELLRKIRRIENAPKDKIFNVDLTGTMSVEGSYGNINKLRRFMKVVMYLDRHRLGRFASKCKSKLDSFLKE